MGKQIKRKRGPLSGAFTADKNKRLYETALAQGWACTLKGNGHVQCVNPDNGHVFDMSLTMPGGSNRAYLNNRAKARRAGLDVYLKGLTDA